jgi:hypothetical protein
MKDCRTADDVRCRTSVRLERKEIGIRGEEGATGEDAISISLALFNLATSALHAF